jgi:hypothetical protein
MNARTILPQQVPSFTKPLLQALAVIVGTTLLLGALWARAEQVAPTTSSIITG